MEKRHETGYPGVFYRKARRIGAKGMEKVFYVVYKKAGKWNEEKAGRQYANDMTAAKAATIRGELIEGKRLPRKEEKAAEEAAKEAEKAVKEAEENRYTVKKLWEEYLENMPGLKGLAQDQNRYELHLADAFGSKEPKEIIPLDVDRLRVSMGKKYSPATVRNTLELLRRIVNFGVNRHLCEALSFKVKMPTVDNIKTEMLSADELARLLKVLDEAEDFQTAALMKLALFLGLRRGELLRLQWTDIDFEQGFVTLRNPKGGKSEIIPLNDRAREVLENHPETSKYVFPGRKNRPRTDVRKAVTKLKEAAGLPKDFRALHGLRHTYASMLASSGKVDLFTLQKLMTHKSPAMVQRYAHLSNEALKRAGSVASELFSNGAEKRSRKVVNLKDEKK